MPQFPIKEIEIAALAQNVASGLELNTVAFPASPVTFETVNDKVAVYFAARDAQLAAKAASVVATSTKDAAVDDMADAIKQVVRYAETIPGYTSDELGLLGWSGRREGSSLEIPGNSPFLTVTGEGPGDITLNWKRPVDGGRPTSYIVERREFGTESWGLAKVSTKRSVTLTEQPRGQSLEYRVLSLNGAGTSGGSNTVSVVL